MTTRVRALLVALALISAAGCRGCKAEPALRLTYQVDVAHAYAAASDATKVMEAARAVVAHRLDELAARATVTVRGKDLVVDLAALPPDDLRIVKDVLASGGRVELKIVDDAGTAVAFADLEDSAYLHDEGISPVQEAAPDGLDVRLEKKTVNAIYARITCRPPKYAAETMGDCLGRFRAWAAPRLVAADHEVGFEQFTERVAGSEPPRFEQTGWRTLYLFRRAELSGETVADVIVSRGADLGQYNVNLTLSPAGAARFEEITGANVNRRLAIVLDGVVESAPVVRAKVSGGHAQITMGAGEPEKQLHDARLLELVLRSGALPAPLRLVSEETLPKRP